LVKATVVPDGSGQRLCLTHTDNSEMAVGGTLVNQTAITSAAVNTANSLAVRADIQSTPSLMSRGAVQYNANTREYYVGSGDNTVMQQMATQMQTSTLIPTAGGLGQNSSTLSGYAANIISTNSTNATTNKQQLTYATTLQSNLNVQKGSVSGVNMDEEVSNLIAYQQAYSASAKVISTIQSLFDVLDTLIH
jgi:flagellar hook-associated protein 1 FlgK